ncbi:MAG: RNA recognition motif domain-containing protein [Breznakibacter sp.]
MNIYISNLSFDVTDKDLNDIFSDYGVVTSAKVIMDRETGRSRGFGFVEMTSDEEARKAIAELDQAEYVGKTIRVNEARPKTDRPRTGGGFSGGGNRGGGSRGGFSGGGNRGGNREGGYNSERKSSNRW